MKLMTSYFYQIRFFEKYMIPFSTAVWDPKWYHERLGPQHLYFDKRGVINGLRAPMLVPPVWCRDACRGYEVCKWKDPNTCAFLQAYGSYVNTLSVPDFLIWLETACNKIKLRNWFDEEPVAVLLFHEKYDNPCSERVPVTQWLQRNGVEVTEFNT